MPQPPLSEEKIQRSVDTLAACGGDTHRAAEQLGIAPRTLNTHIRRARTKNITPSPIGAAPPQDDPTLPTPNGEGFSWDQDGNTARLTVLTQDGGIDTYEKALEHAGIDPDEWECTRFRVTAHQQGQTDADKNARILQMVNVSCELKRRRPDDPVRVKKDVLAFLETHAPKIKAPAWSRRRKRSDVMLEISVPDIHMGKLCDAWETGDDYNIEIARRLCLRAHEHILSEASRRFDIGSIVSLPCEELLHYEGGTYATTKGTRQDYAAIWQRVYRTARETACDAVALCRALAPTSVYVTDCNHARYSTFYLGDAVACYYARDKYVTVDAEPSPYKYHQHGRVLLGFNHGDRAKPQKLQSQMAHDRPEAFASALVREWHMGHWHKTVLEDFESGVLFRRMPSLSGKDSWHLGEGHTGQKAAVGMIWSPEGLLGTVQFTPTEEDYRA